MPAWKLSACIGLVHVQAKLGFSNCARLTEVTTPAVFFWLLLWMLHSTAAALLYPCVSPQEVPQEAGPAGMAGGRHHRHRVPHRRQVRPLHADAVSPVLHHPVLDPGDYPRAHLDSLALLHPVSGAVLCGLSHRQGLCWADPAGFCVDQPPAALLSVRHLCRCCCGSGAVRARCPGLAGCVVLAGEVRGGFSCALS